MATILRWSWTRIRALVGKAGCWPKIQWLLIDFLTNREYGGIVIDWDPEDYATAYEVQISEDGAYWKLAYTGTGSNGGRDYIYMPNVESCYLRLELKQSSRGRGYGIRTIYVEPGASTLYTRYQLQNPEAQPQHVRLFLALRPFQVNPPWQSLNMVGGVTQIRELASAERTVRVNRDKAVTSLTLPDRFGAATFDQGTVLDYLLKGKLPPQTEISDPFGYASGVLECSLDLPPGTSQEVYIAMLH
jgi:hypothetical protein